MTSWQTGPWQFPLANSRSFLRLADDGPRLGPQASGPALPPASDADVLDAYSQAVINVVERVGPSVIALSPPRGEERGGSGSGAIVTPDGALFSVKWAASGVATKVPFVIWTVSVPLSSAASLVFELAEIVAVVAFTVTARSSKPSAVPSTVASSVARIV